MRLRTIAAGAVTLALATAVPFAAGATAHAAEPLSFNCHFLAPSGEDEISAALCTRMPPGPVDYGYTGPVTLTTDNGGDTATWTCRESRLEKDPDVEGADGAKIQAKGCERDI